MKGRDGKWKEEREGILKISREIATEERVAKSLHRHLAALSTKAWGMAMIQVLLTPDKEKVLSQEVVQSVLSSQDTGLSVVLHFWACVRDLLLALERQTLVEAEPSHPVGSRRRQCVLPSGRLTGN